MDSGVGAGIAGPTYNSHFSLSQDTSVFQAELYALSALTQYLRQKNQKKIKINILTDNQAVIKALNKHSFKSKALLECKKSLNELAKSNKTSLIWIPGHEGFKGNERADNEAKKGAVKPLCGPYPSYGFTKNYLYKEIKTWTKNNSRLYWEEIRGQTHSKKFLTGRNFINKEAIILQRKELRILCGALTVQPHFKFNKCK